MSLATWCSPCSRQKVKVESRATGFCVYTVYLESVAFCILACIWRQVAWVIYWLTKILWLWAVWHLHSRIWPKLNFSGKYPFWVIHAMYRKGYVLGVGLRWIMAFWGIFSIFLGCFSKISWFSELKITKFQTFSEKNRQKKWPKNQKDNKGHKHHPKLCHLGPISDENQYLTSEAFWGIEFWFLNVSNFAWTDWPGRQGQSLVSRFKRNLKNLKIKIRCLKMPH